MQADTGGSGAKAGIAIAAIGIAAAAGLFFFLQSAKTSDAPKTAAKTAAVTAEAEPTAKPDEEPQAAPTETAAPDDGSVDLNDLAEASAEPVADPEPEVGGPGPAVGPKALAENNDPKPPATVERVDPDGTLEDEMKKHAGDPTKNGAAPAAEDVRPKNVPDRPATGVVTSAVGAVKGGARSCVAGADDVSTATITFGSSGAVQSVSVSGWAAGKPAASCIQSALKGANVGPFAQPTFSFSVSIRP